MSEAVVLVLFTMLSPLGGLPWCDAARQLIDLASPAEGSSRGVSAEPNGD
jgi:hypothetical protein